jgi:hypothetical protein
MYNFSCSFYDVWVKIFPRITWLGARGTAQRMEEIFEYEWLNDNNISLLLII